ncbi:MAG: hypothetical protein HKN43_01760 [Rhodothermales bacterium]|nr:hypothetical protein [Rhodothermales bacterium]
MPEEILIIVVVAILSGTLLGVVSNIRQYLEAKNNLGENSTRGASLKTSELESMMERAAQNAVQPIVRRIENLEAVVAVDDLPDLLEDTETYFDNVQSEAKIKVTRQNRDR